jgi:hypothetical protein
MSPSSFCSLNDQMSVGVMGCLHHVASSTLDHPALQLRSINSAWVGMRAID